MSKRICLVSDVQYPFHDRKAVKAVLRFIGDYKPDMVIQIGDLLDMPQPSRWSRGTAAEFEGSVLEDAENCKRDFMQPLRDAYDGPIAVHEGNHDLRGREYLAKYAPALAQSGAFNIETLLSFDDYDVQLLPSFYEIAPGWVSTHGHLGGINLSQIAGNTALNAAKKFGKSVVMGHTHRQGIASHTTGYGGNIAKTVTGMELGNLMNMKMAHYLKQGSANWQSGFGILTVEGKTVTPQIVPIVAGRFSVDGHTWEV